MAKKGVIKNHLYYKSSDMINIENIVLQNIRVDKKLLKDIITYYIRYGAVDGVKTCHFILHETIVFTEKGGYIDDDDKCIESTEDGDNKHIEYYH